MLSTPDFLRRLHCTKGTLLLFLLSSWREVADSSGMHGADVLSSLFDAVCRNATEGTSTRARLDTTVFASFWTDGDDVLASQKLEGLTPMVASWGHFRVEVGVEKFTLSSTATTSCGDTYRRAQRQLEEFNSSRGSAAYPALDLDWREAVGGVDLDSPEE